MNYENLSTASDILEAFRICKNPGEEIALFEGLATRPEPPLAAFLEIIEKVKLEAALVLTIKVLGIIVNPEVKVELKQNDELLRMLSDRSKPELSNLVRWAATMAIDAIGFSFLNISQYFIEEPFKIADRIVESKRKILIDLDDRNKGIQKIDRAEYKESVNFWVYGPTYTLRAISSKERGDNYTEIVMAVVKKQDIYGLKETNRLSTQAEARDYPDRLSKEAYENEQFQNFTQRLSVKFLKSDNPDLFKLAIVTQGHALQSNDPVTRLRAAAVLLAADETKLTDLNFAPKLLVVAKALLVCDFELDNNFSYPEKLDKDLIDIISNLKIARELVSRDRVTEYLIDYLNKISIDLSTLAPGMSRKDMLSELEQVELAEQIKQNQLLASEKKRKAEKENEIWSGENKLEITRDKIHKVKSITAKILPQIAALDERTYLKIRAISTKSIPEDDRRLNDHHQLTIGEVKNSCQEYLNKNKEELMLLENIDRDLHSKISKFQKKDSKMAIGYGLLFAGILCTIVPNIWSILIGTILIGGFMFIAKIELEKTTKIKSTAKSIADNMSKAEQIKANIEVINSLISSVSK